MLQYLSQFPSRIQSKYAFSLSSTQKQLGLIAIGLAVCWWLVGLWLLQTETTFQIWGDQRYIFLRDSADALHPYNNVGFFNMPWTRIFLVPFTIPRFELGVFGQILLYFVLLSAVVHRFSDSSVSSTRQRITLLIALCSPFAFDTAIEVNIDWIVVLGLLVPPAYSAPFILTKPQVALGYVASFKWATIVRWTIVFLIVFLLSFLIWGAWPIDLYARSQEYPIGVAVNVSPMNIIGLVPSLLIAITLLLVAFVRKDAVVGIWGGIFLMPYIASYSILLPFTLLAIRFPRAMGVFTLALWIGVGIIIVPGLL